MDSDHTRLSVNLSVSKSTVSPKLTPAFLESLKTLGATKATYLIPQGEPFPLSSEVEAMSLRSFLSRYGA